MRERYSVERHHGVKLGLGAGGFTISQHLLKAYLDSLVAICVAQFFKTKSMKGGLRGVERLSKSSEMCCLMKSCGELLPAYGKLTMTGPQFRPVLGT